MVNVDHDACIQELARLQAARDRLRDAIRRALEHLARGEVNEAIRLLRAAGVQ